MNLGLSWNGRHGQLRRDGLVAALQAKPELGFAFDGLVYDQECGIFFKFVDGGNTALAEAEKAACAAFVAAEIENAEYEVYVYRDDFIFEQALEHTEAVALGLQFTPLRPDHPASRFNPAAGDNGQWEYLAAVIDEEGKLRLGPDRAIEENFGLFLTAEEWEAFPQPEGFPGPVKWSFEQEAWVDDRNLAEEKINMAGDLHARIENRAGLLFGRFVSTYDVCRWAGSPDKREFMAYNLVLERFARLRAEYAAQIEAAEDLPALDAAVAAYREILAGEVPELDLEGTIKTFMTAIQLRLDEFAQSRGYDEARSCVATYRGCANATYAAEAEYMQEAVVRTWEFANDFLNAVLAGQKAMCGWEEFEAELEAAVPLNWPVPDTRATAE